MRLTIALLVLLAACNTQDKDKTDSEKRAAIPDSSSIVIPEKAQNSYAAVDRSPMDMTYFPADYPLLKMTDSAPPRPSARVIYSRPYLAGRPLFTKILKYGEPWRLGANEATELELYSSAIIQGRRVNAGRYTLYCIPQQDTWTVVLNSNVHTWGLHPDSTKDIARFTIPVTKTQNFFEFFTMAFIKTEQGADLVMAWERLESRLPFKF